MGYAGVTAIPKFVLEVVHVLYMVEEGKNDKVRVGKKKREGTLSL